MEHPFDLYTLLGSYAFKNCSPVVDLETFIKFLEKNAERGKSKDKFKAWKTGAREKVMKGVLELLEEQKISAGNEGGLKKITLNSFYPDLINRAYSRPETGRDPFPDETTLKAKIPENLIKVISVQDDLPDYLREEHNKPEQIIKLVFPEDYGSAITLESHFPDKILEFSLVKISEGMKQRREIEFFTQKALSQFKSAELLARDTINMLIIRPVLCMKTIGESGEFVFSFWQFLCPLILSHIKEKAERNGIKTGEDFSFGQAASLIYVFNTYYQIIARQKKEKEQAFNLAYQMLSEPPYIYSINDIMGFTNKNGIRILESYTPKDMEEFIKDKITVTREDVIPSLLKFKTRTGAEIYVRKEKVLLLCMKLLSDVKYPLKEAIQERWKELLRNFNHEAAMDDDDKFERLLFRICIAENSVMMNIIQDKRVALIEIELAVSGSGSGDNTKSKDIKIYDGFRLLPLRTLLALNRKDILRDVKVSLPFWYSVSLLVKIARFFKSGLKKQVTVEDEETAGAGKTAELQDLLKKISGKLVPENALFDPYMSTVKDRWNQLIKKQDSEKLTNDVNEIIRTNLNHALEIYSAAGLTERILDNIAESIMHSNIYSFRFIRDKNALLLYVKLYIIKLLKLKLQR